MSPATPRPYYCLSIVQNIKKLCVSYGHFYIIGIFKSLIAEHAVISISKWWQIIWVIDLNQQHKKNCLCTFMPEIHMLVYYLCPSSMPTYLLICRNKKSFAPHYDLYRESLKWYYCLCQNLLTQVAYFYIVCLPYIILYFKKCPKHTCLTLWCILKNVMLMSLPHINVLIKIIKLYKNSKLLF